MPRIIPGDRFGKWTALKKIRMKALSGRVRSKWKVRCDCGNLRAVESYDLKAKKSTKCKSCAAFC